MKGQLYMMETRRREFKKKRIKLANQISLLDDLLKTKSVAMVKTELNRIESTFTEIKSLAELLLAVIDEEEKEQVTKTISEDQVTVVEVGNRVERWLVSQGKEDTMSGLSKSSKTPEIKNTMQLTVELVMVQSRLENQMALVDQVLEMNNVGLMKGELDKLESINREMKRILNTLGEGVLIEEKKKIVDIVEKADTKLSYVKGQVENQMNSNDEDRRSHRSEQSKVANGSFKSASKFDPSEEVGTVIQNDEQ